MKELRYLVFGSNDNFDASEDALQGTASNREVAEAIVFSLRMKYSIVVDRYNPLEQTFIDRSLECSS